MIRRSQHGFELFTLILLVAVLAIIGLAGYKVYERLDSQKSSSLTTAPAKIESGSDIDQAVNSLDSSDADSQLDPSQLDEDISELL